MRKPRKNYAYVARRIDPNDPQNLGDFAIRRRLPEGIEWPRSRTYHYASEDYDGRHGSFRRGRIVNRQSMGSITRGGSIYAECIRAVERLLKEEQK